jgi:hypothetical protein
MKEEIQLVQKALGVYHSMGTHDYMKNDYMKNDIYMTNNNFNYDK